MTTKKALRKLEAIRALQNAGINDIDMARGFRLSSAEAFRKMLLQLEEVEMGIEGLIMCSAAGCSGHAYIMHETTASAQTCIEREVVDEEGRDQTEAQEAA